MTVPLGGKKAAGRVSLVDDDDYDLVMRHRWHVKETILPNGVVDERSAATQIPGINGGQRTLRMHQLIMPGIRQIDHINRNGLDNQKHNLRSATSAQNSRNTQPHRDSRSPYKGVSWYQETSKWTATIWTGGKNRYLGRFANPADAARVYDQVARELFGEFAWLNCDHFPELR